MDWLLISLFLCLSAFFSGSESAIFSIRWWRINYLRHKAGVSGQILADIMERPRAVLITILLGNTLVNVAASSLTEHQLEILFPGQGLLLAIVAMTIVLLVVGEITPKTLAIRRPERIALVAARPIRWLSQLIYPVRIVLEWLSDAITRRSDENAAGKRRIDFLTLINESRRAEIINESEHSMLTQIMQLNSVSIHDVMIPRTDIIALPDTLDFDEAVEAMLKTDFRRVPIYHESLDNIVGILYAKDLLGGWLNPVLRRAPKTMARNPFYVPGFINLKKLSAELRENRCHLAIVLDEYGGTAGLVTHDDILRAIFARSGDLSKNVKVINTFETGWDVDSRITWEDLTHLMKLAPKKHEFRTLNGSLLDRFGRVPDPGETIDIELQTGHGVTTWKMEILDTEPIRIGTVRITGKSSKPNREIS